MFCIHLVISLMMIQRRSTLTEALSIHLLLPTIQFGAASPVAVVFASSTTSLEIAYVATVLGLVSAGIEIVDLLQSASFSAWLRRY